MGNRHEEDLDDHFFATFVLDRDRGFEAGAEESGHD